MPYLVYSNFPGCLAESGPNWHKTLESAKDDLRWTRETWKDDESQSEPEYRKAFHVINLLRSITRKNLLDCGAIVYGALDRKDDPCSLPFYLSICWTDDSEPEW